MNKLLTKHIHLIIDFIYFLLFAFFLVYIAVPILEGSWMVIVITAIMTVEVNEIIHVLVRKFLKV